MGSFQAKGKSTNMKYKQESDVVTLRAKVKLQKEEMKEIISMREMERQAYEQELMVFVLKEAEWKRERMQLSDEVKNLETEKGKIEGFMDLEVFVANKDGNDWKMLEKSYLMECMRGERLRRDEAVEKWKRLYLAIKNELDHLIKMTHQEDRMAWRLEEANFMNELNRALQVKEDTIEQLREQFASKEKENRRLEREVDILKQSSRIMTHKKAKKMSKCLKKSGKTK